jgi:hypothetical protein
MPEVVPGTAPVNRGVIRRRRGSASRDGRAPDPPAATRKDILMDTTTTRTDRTVNQTVALVFGAVYLVVGAAGFLVDSNGFADTQGGKLLGLFEVNPLHNIAHLLIGAALVLASRTLTSARTANTVVGAAYLLLGIVGLFILDSDANILALNAADNVLHFATAALLLAVGASADKSVRAGR